MGDGRLPDCVNSAGTSHPQALHYSPPMTGEFGRVRWLAALCWHGEVYMKL